MKYWIKNTQEHDGTVDANSPEVTYTFSDGSNSALRKLSVSIPSGHKVNYDYGAANSIADAFNRPDSLRIDGETGNLVEYDVCVPDLRVIIIHELCEEVLEGFSPNYPPNLA